ncbi:MAG TPA: hypothetical protein VGC78_12660 [Gaiellaceae bacterium]
MRKLAFAAVTLVALAATGVAVAHGIRGTGSPSAVTATFTAAAAKTSSWNCTTSDAKAVVVTRGTYTGTATGSPDLTGAITLQVRSIVGATSGVGVVDGAFRIDVGKGADARGLLTGVYDHGSVAGVLVGRSHGSAGRLVANVSASFAAASGFTNGKIGGTTGGGAVEVAGGRCKLVATDHPGGGSSRTGAKGAIAAISPASITVGGLTCAIPQGSRASALLPRLGLKVGDRVEIRCEGPGGSATLTAVERIR